MKLNIHLNTGTAGTPIVSGSKHRTLEELERVLKSLEAGIGYGGPSLSGSAYIATFSDVEYAKGQLFINAGTGAVTASINGTAVAAFLTGTNDAVKANHFASLVNASAASKVQGYVSAVPTSGALGSTVTVYAAMPGLLGNMCTLSGTGVGFKAIGADNAATNFVSGSSGAFNSWKLG